MRPSELTPNTPTANITVGSSLTFRTTAVMDLVDNTSYNYAFYPDELLGALHLYCLPFGTSNGSVIFSMAEVPGLSYTYSTGGTKRPRLVVFAASECLVGTVPSAAATPAALVTCTLELPVPPPPPYARPPGLPIPVSSTSARLPVALATCTHAACFAAGEWAYAALRPPAPSS